MGRTTTLPVDLVFLYISLALLHDYDVKMPNSSRFVEDVNTRQRLSFPFPELRYNLIEMNLTQRKKSTGLISLRLA